MKGAGARGRSRSPHLQGSGSASSIVELVFARERARKDKNFPESDALRDQLAAMGVQLFDKSNSWKSSDGQSGTIPSWSDLETMSPETFSHMSMQADVLDPNDPNAQVKHMVQQRETARAAKDFQGADRIREELRGYGIEVYDKEKLWKGQDGSVGIICGFLGGQITELEITTLVQGRETARMNKDFNLSDIIRDELQAKGISIFDKEKIWKASDGRSGHVPAFGTIAAGGISPGFGRAPAPIPTMQQSQPVYGTLRPPVAAVDLRSLQEQIVAQALASAYDVHSAQNTLSTLRSGGPVSGVSYTPPSGVVIPATVPRHMAAQPTYASQAAPPAAAASGMGEEAIQFCHESTGRALAEEEIAWLVEIRERLRHVKDMASADALRTAMKLQCGLDVFDKEKLWKTTDGRQGAVPPWSSFV